MSNEIFARQALSFCNLFRSHFIRKLGAVSARFQIALHCGEV